MKTLAYGAATTPGHWPVQEDAFYADPGKGFFFLGDGVGGAGRGDSISRYAILQAKALVQSGAVLADAYPAKVQSLTASEKSLHLLGQKIQEMVLAKNESLSPAMAAGLSLLLASLTSEGRFSIWSCGACGVGLWRNGALFSISLPQLWFPLEEGTVLPRQVLGIGNIAPEIKSLQLLPGDCILLHSSGVSLEDTFHRDSITLSFSERTSEETLQSLSLRILERLGASGKMVFNQSLLLVEV